MELISNEQISLDKAHLLEWRDLCTTIGCRMTSHTLLIELNEMRNDKTTPDHVISK
jgi:hypothetical protein